MIENTLAWWHYRLQLKVFTFQQFHGSLHGFAARMEALSWAMLAFLFRRFVILVSRVLFVLMILANVHISTASGKFTHVILSPESKSSAIFKTKTIGRLPRLTRDFPLRAEGAIGCQSEYFVGKSWQQSSKLLTFFHSPDEGILFQLQRKEITFHLQTKVISHCKLH